MKFILGMQYCDIDSVDADFRWFEVKRPGGHSARTYKLPSRDHRQTFRTAVDFVIWICQIEKRQSKHIWHLVSMDIDTIDADFDGLSREQYLWLERALQPPKTVIVKVFTAASISQCFVHKRYDIA
jgi:hypothetical protein